MNKKNFVPFLLIVFSFRCLPMELTQEQYLQQQIDSLGNEKQKITNALLHQKVNLGCQHATRLSAFAAVLATTWILKSQMPSKLESCEQARLKECIAYEKEQTFLATSTSLTGAFLLIEIVFFFMSICTAKMG